MRMLVGRVSSRVIALVLTVIPASGLVLAADNSPVALSLPAKIRAAANQFTVPTPAVLKQSADGVLRSSQILSKKLLGQTEGKEVRELLGLEQLESELSSGKPATLETLKLVSVGLAADIKEIRTLELAALRDALSNHIRLLRIVDNPEAQKSFQENVKQLASAVEAFQSQPSRTTAASVVPPYQWLRSYRQIPEILREVRTLFEKPNLHVQSSRDFLNALIERPRSVEQDINAFEMGAHVVGKAAGSAMISLQLVPSPNKASVDVTFNGRATAHSTGTKQMGLLKRKTATIEAHTEIGVQGALRAEMDSSGVSLFPPRIRADADTQPESASVTTYRPRRGSIQQNPILTKFALRVFQGMKAETDQKAEQRTVTGLAESIAKDTEQIRANANQRFGNMMGSQPTFGEESISSAKKGASFQTTETHVLASIPVALNDQLAAYEPPPPPTPPRPFESLLQLHESVVNNFSRYLEGKEFDNDTLQQMFREIVTYDPPISEYLDPIKVTFAEESPLTATFDQNLIGLRIRTMSVASGGKQFENAKCDAQVTYQVGENANGLVLTRNDQITLDCGNAPAEAKALVDTFVKFVLGKGLVARDIPLQEHIKKEVSLTFKSASSSAGWLSAIVLAKP